MNTGKVEPPTVEQWMEIVEEIHLMEKMTYRLRLQETQYEEKWEKWSMFKIQISDKEYWLIE